MNRKISWILVLAMLLSMALAPVSSAYGATTPTMEVSYEDEAGNAAVPSKNGDIFFMTMDLHNIETIAGLTVYITYDPAAVQIVNASGAPATITGLVTKNLASNTLKYLNEELGLADYSTGVAAPMAAFLLDGSSIDNAIGKLYLTFGTNLQGVDPATSKAKFYEYPLNDTEKSEGLCMAQVRFKVIDETKNPNFQFKYRSEKDEYGYYQDTVQNLNFYMAPATFPVNFDPVGFGPQPPKAPKNVTAEVKSDTAITLNWEASDTADYYQVSNGVSQTTTSALTHDWTGLTKGTEYQFSVKGHNDLGYGAAGTVSATTWSEPAAPELTLSNGGPLKIKADWTKPADNGTALTAYNLYVSTEAACNGNYVSGYGPKVINDPTVLSEVIENLTDQQTYYAKIQAVNSIGDGAFSDVKSFKALNIVDAATPTFTTSTSAIVNYGETATLDAAAAITDNGTMTYQWYQTSSASDSQNGTQISGAVQAAYTTPALTAAGDTYYYCVVTNTNTVDAAIGQTGGMTAVTATSPVITVTTKALAPDKPSNLKAEGNEALAITWTAPNGRGDDVTEYTITVSGMMYTGKDVTTYQVKYQNTSGEAITLTMDQTQFDSDVVTTSGGAIVTVAGTTYAAIVVPETVKEKADSSLSTTGAFTNCSYTTPAGRLLNGTEYTVAVAAKNRVGYGEAAEIKATPKVPSSGGGSGSGGGKGSGSSSVKDQELVKSASGKGDIIASNSEIKNASKITMKNSLVQVSFDKTATEYIKQNAGSGTLKVVAVESKLPSNAEESAKRLIGDRPIVDIVVQLNGKTIASYNGGSIQIALAYTPKNGEDTNKLRMYYIDEKGEASLVSGSKYDSSLKAVVGNTKHTSVYAVAYDENAASDSGLFADVKSGDWYYDSVMYLANRGIANGTTNSKGEKVYKPNDNITRAEFVQMLAMAAKANLSGYTSSNFADVKDGDWYLGAVEWASQNGVVYGSTNHAGQSVFAPNEKITRQDMATILDRFNSNIMKKELTAKETAISFSDSGAIAGYAAEAITKLQRADIINGYDDNTFKPQSNATRAEVAVMLAGYLK